MPHRIGDPTLGGRRAEGGRVRSAMSLASKRELAARVAPRYREARRREKSVILCGGVRRRDGLRAQVGDSGPACTDPASRTHPAITTAPVRCGGARGAVGRVGGGRLHLRQAAGAVPTRAGAVAGAPWPPERHRRGAGAAPDRQPGDRRPDAATAARAGARRHDDQAGRAAQAPDRGPHVRRLERRPARLHGSRSGCALRRGDLRRLPALAGADRRGDRLDRVPGVAGQDAAGGRGGAGPRAPAPADPAARVRHRQRQRVPQRRPVRLLRARRSPSPADAATTRTTSASSSRRTARWCGGWSGTTGSKGNGPTGSSPSCTGRRGCT